MHNHEQQQLTIDTIPAREIFASPQQLSNNVAEAIANGVITTVEVPRDATDVADVHARVLISEDEIMPGSLSEQEDRRGNKFGKFEDFAFKDNQVILDRTKTVFDQNLGNIVYNDNDWYLKSPAISQELEVGSVSEQYEITGMNRESIKLINFTDNKLTETQLSEVKRALALVASLSGGSIFNAAKAVCILKADRFKGKTIGSVSAYSGAIQLNEKLINGSLGEEDAKFQDLDTTMLESTLIHESGHLVELLDTQKDVYGKGTGWAVRTNSFVDDYGNAIQDQRDKLGTPELVKSDDDSTEVAPAIRKYSAETLHTAKPVTEYGHTNRREDFAEAFVAFAASDRDDFVTLDEVRRDAIAGILRRSAKTYGPFNIEVNPLPLHTRIGFDVKPATYTVAEPIFLFDRPVSGQDTADSLPIAPAYRMQQNTGQDDYGNYFEMYGGHVPAGGKAVYNRNY
jgi:hypothetical protein